MKTSERTSRSRRAEAYLQKLYRTSVFEVSQCTLARLFRSQLDWQEILRVTLEQRLACPASQDIELYRAVVEEVPRARELAPSEHSCGVRMCVRRLLRGSRADVDRGWDRTNIALLIQVVARCRPDRAAALCARYPEAAAEVPGNILAAVREWALRESKFLERLLSSRYFGVLKNRVAANALGPRVVARALVSGTPWIRERAYALLPFLSGREGDASLST